MRSIVASIIFVALILGLGGCRNPVLWHKKDKKPQPNAIMTHNEDVMAFNDFRTIDASSGQSKQNTSLLWDKSQARDIEHRLGVVQE